MTQNGVVTKLLDGGMAEVAVERGTACGGRCDNCEACVYANRLVVSAENRIYAGPGDRVVLESETKHIMGAAALVYLLPVALFFAGYAIGAAAGLKEGLCVLASLIGMALGTGIAVVLGRRNKKISFRITGYTR